MDRVPVHAKERQSSEEEVSVQEQGCVREAAAAALESGGALSIPGEGHWAWTREANEQLCLLWEAPELPPALLPGSAACSPEHPPGNGQIQVPCPHWHLGTPVPPTNTNCSWSWAGFQQILNPFLFWLHACSLFLCFHILSNCWNPTAA